MSFAVSIARVALGDGLEGRLHDLFAADVAKAREDEIRQATRRALDFKRSEGTVVGDALKEHASAQARALESARVWKAQDRVVSHLKLLHREEQTSATATALGQALGISDELEAISAEHDKLADEAHVRCLAAVPPEEIVHVGIVFDAIIKWGIDAIVVASHMHYSFGASAIRCSIGGHVEDAFAVEGHPGLMDIQVHPVK